MLVMFAACAPAPRSYTAPEQPSATPWCMRLVFHFDEALCLNAQRRALRWGGMAGVREVGGCEVRR